MSDTLKVVIEVRKNIPFPESVKNLIAISRIKGTFTFKWPSAKNADGYQIFRSKDTTGFIPIDTITDSSFSNTIKDSSFYYYVVSTNSQGSSAPSPHILSSLINTPPKWTKDTIKVEVLENDSIIMNLANLVNDTNGDKISFQMTSGDPIKNSLVFGTWQYKATYSDSGSHMIKISASDGIEPKGVELTIILHVKNVNRKPIFDQDKPKTTYSLNAGEVLSFDINASDPDGDSVKYFIKSSTLPRLLPIIVGKTVSWQSALTDSVSGIIVLGTYDYKDTTTTSIAISVGKVNAIPMLSIFNGAQALSKNQILRIKEGDTLRLSANVTDLDSAKEIIRRKIDDKTIFSCATLFTFDSTTGAFVFSPSYACAASNDSLIIQNIKFISSDNGTPAPLSDTFPISIVVINKNQPPKLSIIGNKSINEGQNLTFNVAATDPDGDTPILSILSLPATASFANGTFSWTPSYSQANSYLVKFIASDGSLSDTQAITITVNNVNQPPVISTIGNKTINEGQSLSFNVTATDPDGTTPTISALGLPTGATFANGSFSWTPSYSQANSYSVKFIASDGLLSDTQSISIAVNIVVTPPTGFSLISGNSSITLNWSAPTSTATAYNIYFLQSSTVSILTGTKIALGSQLTYTKTGLTNGEKYAFVVTAIKGGIESAASNVKTGIPRNMVSLSGGSFFMGQTGISEPVHTVNLSPFKMDATEITQADYLRLMAANPSNYKPDLSHPVESTTWFDAVLYCNARSLADGKDTVYSFSSIVGPPGNGCSDLPNLVINVSKNGYRLPTEAEWEYACRGGTLTNFWWGADTSGINDREWTAYNTTNTEIVATKMANPFGLYDINGNVSEWCNDWSSTYPSATVSDPIGDPTGTSRTFRGGSFSKTNYRSQLFSAYRSATGPSSQNSDLGFRCVCR